MISLYSGTPRSGKSLHAAERIIAWSRQGSPVIANFECNLSRYKKAKFTYCSNADLTPDFLIKFSQDYFQGQRPREREFLLVIDECQLLFSSLNGRNKARYDWLRFFTLHGKLGYDVILIAQNDRMIDRQIRGVIEYEFIHRKLNNFGMQGFLLRCFTFGAGFIVIQHWYPIKQNIGQQFFRAKKRVYSIYDTYVLFDQNDSVNISGQKETSPLPAPQEAKDSKKRKSFILLRSLGRWFHKSKYRFKRSLRRLRSALLDAFIILGGAALIAGIWYLCWC